MASQLTIAGIGRAHYWWCSSCDVAAGETLSFGSTSPPRCPRCQTTEPVREINGAEYEKRSQVKPAPTAATITGDEIARAIGILILQHYKTFCFAASVVSACAPIFLDRLAVLRLWEAVDLEVQKGTELGLTKPGRKRHGKSW